MGGIDRRLVVPAVVVIASAVARDARAHDEPPRDDDDAPMAAVAAPPVAPAASCPKCCQTNVELGPRVGVSINGDQWLGGAHLRSSMPCLGTLGLGPQLVIGAGGNHISIRSAGRLDYMLWFDDAHTFGIFPAVGASVRFYLPVGRFASFCYRVHLAECSGYDAGTELGGGIRFRWASLDAMIGSHGLPVLTIMAAASFRLVDAEAP